MPVLEQNGSGALNVSSAMTNLWREEIIGGAPGPYNGNAELYTNQLPRLVFWLRQTAGAVPASIIPQFAVRGSPAALTGQLYLPLSGAVVMPALNTPLLLTFEMPCDFTRVNITTGVAGTTIEVLLAAYAS